MRACVYGYRNVVEDDGRLKGRVKSGTVNTTRRKGYPSYLWLKHDSPLHRRLCVGVLWHAKYHSYGGGKTMRHYN